MVVAVASINRSIFKFFVKKVSLIKYHEMLNVIKAVALAVSQSPPRAEQQVMWKAHPWHPV